MIQEAATAYMGVSPKYPEGNVGAVDKLAQNLTFQKLVAESGKIVSKIFR